MKKNVCSSTPRLMPKNLEYAIQISFAETVVVFRLAVKSSIFDMQQKNHRSISLLLF